MNKDILMALDHLANPDKYTKVQLKDNALAADATYRAVADVDVWDAYAVDAAATATATAAAYAAVFTAAVAAADINTEYWIDKYFERSGENKDDYITELNK